MTKQRAVVLRRRRRVLREEGRGRLHEKEAAGEHVQVAADGPHSRAPVLLLPPPPPLTPSTMPLVLVLVLVLLVVVSAALCHCITR